VRLGRTGGTALRIDDVGDLALDELRAAWEGTLPARFGGPTF
jgi:phosphoribosylformylglycinamidine synthase